MKRLLIPCAVVLLGISQSYAQEVSSSQTKLTNGQVMETGVWKKQAPGGVEISFKAPFKAPPAVVVTPFWNGSASGVAYAETLTSVSADKFTVVSANSAPDYFVSWMAIGQR